MDHTTLVAEGKDGQEQPLKEMPSLYEVCRQVVDRREARGKRRHQARRSAQRKRYSGAVVSRHRCIAYVGHSAT